VVKDLGNDMYVTQGGWGLNEPGPGQVAGSQTKPLKEYQWDDKNRMQYSNNGSYNVYYTYGEDGERTGKWATSNAGGESETLYFGRLWSWHYDGMVGDYTGMNSKHVFLGETRIATKVVYADGSFIQTAEKEKQYYYHSDHLGSAQLVTDYKGDEYERFEYTPYGEVWIEKASAVSALDVPYRFTGKERDKETGLYYYGARYLDPKDSRWLSVDPAMGDYVPSPGQEAAKLPGMGGVFNTVNLHVYNYSLNNPIKYSDPDGQIPFMVVTGIIGAVAGAGISIAADVAAGRDINWGRAGIAAGAGAPTGLTLGVTAAMAATATPLVAGNAAASFSTVTGIGAATTATVATTSALPLGTEVSKQYSNILTTTQLSSLKKKLQKFLIIFLLEILYLEIV
jgi:RHS repeat-associated protein